MDAENIKKIPAANAEKKHFADRNITTPVIYFIKSFLLIQE